MMTLLLFVYSLNAYMSYSAGLGGKFSSIRPTASATSVVFCSGGML
jgi:hypothetical protein